MSILNTLYVSGGRQAIYGTLEIANQGRRLFLIRAYVPMTAALETGEVVTFEPSSIQYALPEKNADGSQDLQFSVSNINGEASTMIREALTDNWPTTVTYREYLSGDIGAPAKRPLVLEVRDGAWTPLQADLRAGFMNLLDTAWPRKFFNTIDHPGLRYLS